MAKAKKKQKPREEVESTGGAIPGTPEWDAVVDGALSDVVTTEQVTWRWADRSVIVLGPPDSVGNSYATRYGGADSNGVKLDRLYADIVARGLESNIVVDPERFPSHTMMTQYRAIALGFPPATRHGLFLSTARALMMAEDDRFAVLDDLRARGVALTRANVKDAVSKRNRAIVRDDGEEAPATEEQKPKTNVIDITEAPSAGRSAAPEDDVDEQAFYVADALRVEDYEDIPEDDDDDLSEEEQFAIWQAAEAKRLAQLGVSDDKIAENTFSTVEEVKGSKKVQKARAKPIDDSESHIIRFSRAVCYTTPPDRQIDSLVSGLEHIFNRDMFKLGEPDRLRLRKALKKAIKKIDNYDNNKE